MMAFTQNQRYVVIENHPNDSRVLRMEQFRLCLVEWEQEGVTCH